MSDHRPMAIDLFAGCGGVTLGLKKAGFRVLAAVEVDDVAASTFSLNHPEVIVVKRDIRRVSAKRLRENLGLKTGALDLIAACPPCQGFSSLTTRNGARRNRDRDNGLVLEVSRFVRAFRPKYLILENVPHLISSSFFQRLKERLAGHGYEFTTKIVDVAKFGVPQRRRRLIVLAKAGSTPIAISPQPLKRTVRDAIGCLAVPRNSRDKLHNYRVELREDVIERIRLTPRNGGSRHDLPPRFHLACHRRMAGYNDVYGRMRWCEPSPTITGGCINPSKGRFLHPTQNRPITLREAALLQTFPPRYRFDTSRGRYAVALMIGNAMPPLFIAYHAAAIRRDLHKGT